MTAREIYRELLVDGVVHVDGPRWGRDGSIRIVLQCPPPSYVAERERMRQVLAEAIAGGLAEFDFSENRRDAGLLVAGEIRIDLRGGSSLVREAATAVLERGDEPF